MAKLFNIARMTTATPGTGTVTLGSAVSGYITFAQAGVQNGDEVTYVLEEGSNREIGRGIYSTSGPTLTRATVLNSTAGGTTKIALVGAATAFIDAAAQDFVTSSNIQSFTASGTWTKPTDQPYTMVMIECGGGGGSGGRRATTGNAGGGGGGGYTVRIIPMASLGAIETVTIGAGGAAITTGDSVGNAGGDTTIGSWIAGYGGGGGDSQASGTAAQGGGGGGLLGIGTLGTVFNTSSGTEGGGAVGGNVQANNSSNVGVSAYRGGGGGGASSNSTVRVGGTSVHGGNGGASSSTVAASPGLDGSTGADGGGGGGGGGSRGFNSGAGGKGWARVTCW